MLDFLMRDYRMPKNINGAKEIRFTYVEQTENRVTV